MYRRVILLCIAWLYGVSAYLLEVQPPPPEQAKLYTHITEFMPLSAWGCLWGLVAVLAVLGAFFKRWFDIAAFCTAEFVIAAWATLFAWSFWQFHIYRGLLSVSVYYVLAVMFATISGWVDHKP